MGTAIQSLHQGLGPKPWPRETHSSPPSPVLLLGWDCQVPAGAFRLLAACAIPFQEKKIISIPSYNYLKFIQSVAVIHPFKKFNQ